MPCWKLKHEKCIQNIVRERERETEGGHGSSSAVEISSLAWSSPLSQSGNKNHQHCAHSSKELYKKSIQLEVEKNWNLRASWYIYMTSIWIIWDSVNLLLGLEFRKNMPVLIARLVWISNRTGCKQPLVIGARRLSIKILGTQKCWRGWPTA